MGAGMESDHWPHGSCDGCGRSLAQLRHRASGFFESLSVAELGRETHRHLWVSDWLRVADDYRTFAKFAGEDGTIPTAREAWLCALTALEVVRSVSCPGDVEAADFANEVDISLKGLADDAGPAIERVTLEGFDEAPLTGFFVPALCRTSSAPAVICVGDEDITLGSMMIRLLPASLRHNISLLLVDARHSSARRPFKPEQMLQCWLDYLQGRADVDPQRIAIYGEGAGAGHASRLARADRRLAAAVCDGGLLSPVMCRASLRWMTDVEQAALDASVPVSMMAPRQLPCPLLMVVGSRSMMLEQDALELQSAYRQAGADCSVVVPSRIPHPLGEVENFVAVDDFIFEWLDSKLGSAPQLEDVTYL
ncbi:alpha/beta hydrolase [Bradyrhizobium sp. CCBAU 53351]|uniref:alpha/beta hydrolase n=1 Tax=Bradyrhizobium sp. CCBAU 53351 TaxID=1325114 RepID=UPI00352C3756